MTFLVEEAMPLIHEDLTHSIRGLLYTTHNAVGVGLHEENYHRELVQLLLANRIEFRTKPKISLIYRDSLIQDYFPDIVIADQVILELKSSRYGINDENYLQLLTYLKLSGLTVGMIVNFGMHRVQIKRLVYHAKPAKMNLAGGWPQAAKERLFNALDIIAGVLDTAGQGYSESIYTRLLAREAQYRSLQFELQPLRSVRVDDVVLGNERFDGLLLDQNTYILSTAYRESSIDFELDRCRTAARYTQSPNAVLVNFGSQQTDVFLVR